MLRLPILRRTSTLIPLNSTPSTIFRANTNRFLATTTHPHEGSSSSSTGTSGNKNVHEDPPKTNYGALKRVWLNIRKKDGAENWLMLAILIATGGYAVWTLTHEVQGPE
jgi:hypothetical protein